MVARTGSGLGKGLRYNQTAENCFFPKVVNTGNSTCALLEAHSPRDNSEVESPVRDL